MNAFARTTTAPMPIAPDRLPATTSIARPYNEYPDLSPDMDTWTRDEILDLALAASEDGYKLASRTRYVERVCAEMCTIAAAHDLVVAQLRDANQELAELRAALAAAGQRETTLEQDRDVAQLQLDAELAVSMRKDEENARLRGELERARAAHLEVAFERVTVKATGMSAAALTAHLNEQIRAHRAPDMLDLDETVVIDLDAVTGVAKAVR